MKLPADTPKLKFAAVALPLCGVLGGVLRIADVSPVLSLWISTSGLGLAFAVFAATQWRRSNAELTERREEAPVPAYAGKNRRAAIS